MRKTLLLTLVLPFVFSCAALAAEEPWGEASNGLRCAITLEKADLRVGDEFVLNVRVQNTSDKTVRLYLPSEYLAGHLEITDQAGKRVPSEMTAKYESGPVAQSFREIKPAVVYDTQIRGRLRFEFVPASSLPGEGSPRRILLDSRDTAHYLAKAGMLTAAFRLACDAQTVKLGRRYAVKPVWTGELVSNAVAFSVRLMTREELDSETAKLDAGRQEEIAEAAAVLGANADRAAVPALVKALCGGPGEAGQAASNALRAIQDRSVVAELVARYKQADENGPQRAILETIVGLAPDDESTVDLLAEVLKSQASWEARQYAAGEMTYLAQRRVIKVTHLLMEAAGYKDPIVQYPAIDGLASLSSDGLRSMIAIRLREIMKSDPDRTVRGRAAGALGMMGDPPGAVGGVPVEAALIAALSDSDLWVGADAANALGRMGGPGAIPGLREYAKWAERDSQRRAAEAAITAIQKRLAGK